MPTVITKRILSGSTHGVGQIISSTQGGTNQTIHSLSTSATTTLDEVYIYAQNNYSAAVEVVFEWGTSQSGLHLAVSVPPRDGPTLVVPGLLLTGSACSITAFIGTNGFNGSASPAVSGSGLVSVYGYVNRIVQT